MQRLKNILLKNFLILFSLPYLLLARQIEPDVQLTLDKLPLEKQNMLQNFAKDIEAYLLDADYMDEDMEEPIPVKIIMFLQDASVGYEDRYRGTIVVSNGEDIQYYDKYFKFPYKPNTPLVQQEGSYDPFTGLIDFFVYLVIAAEYDKYGKLSGTSYYEKARLISQQAAFDTQFSSGWKERQELIDYLFSEDFKAFRIMKDVYYAGIAYIGEDDQKAMEQFNQSIKMLEDILYNNPDHSDALNFLKAHHIDLVEIFKGNEEILRTLSTIDPEHKETYEKDME